MNVKHYLIFIIGLLFVQSVKAQEERTEICIDFRLNSRSIDSTYMDNATRLDEIISAFKNHANDTTYTITQVTFSGVASPEGHSQINQRLAKARMMALENYVRSHINVPDSLVVYHNDHYIPWQYLTAEVEASDMSNKEEILSILRSPKVYVPYHNNTTIDSRVPALQKLDGGRAWSILNQRYFAKMRNACVILLTLQKKATVEPELVPEVKEVSVPEAQPVDTTTATQDKVVLFIIPEVLKADKQKGIQNLYLKTNTLGWGLLISNIAIEADLGKHWSATLPIYYSALNYFTSTLKFRTLAFQPEVRYWLNEDNQGLFGGAHLGLAWFNYATSSEKRYQDRDGNSPAWGGGFSIGYRMPMSKNGRWYAEFTVGAGIYDAHYDTFYKVNNSNQKDTHHNTYVGIDQAAMTIAYRFNIKQKGGKQ